MQDTVAGAIACSICSSGTLEEIFAFREIQRVTSDCKIRPAGGRIGVCRDCGAVQKPADAAFLAEIEDIYRDYTIYHQAAGEEQSVFEQSSGASITRSRKLLDVFRRHAKLEAAGRMLDVGCGNGATLRAFGHVAPGWSKVGTEFDDKYRGEVESIPNTEPLHVGSIETVSGVFDVITMVHVLEHIVNPIALLRSLRGKLATDGRLLIEVPNHPANPFELLIADHRTHFTAGSLTRALAAAGFGIEVVADDWIAKELTVVARPATGSALALQAEDARSVRARIEDTIGWLRRAAEQLRNLRSTGPVGLFGTSIAGTWLAAETGDAVNFFVDEDPARAGRMYLGRPVHAPAQVPPGSRVFVGLPAAVANAICDRMTESGVEFIPPQ